MIESGEEFLNRLYKDMYKSDEVMHGIEARFIGNKIENIKTYLDRMETLHNRINDKISGFGYRKDPRIAEIIKKRNIKKDLARLFKCSEREIGISP